MSFEQLLVASCCMLQNEGFVANHQQFCYWNLLIRLTSVQRNTSLEFSIVQPHCFWTPLLPRRSLPSSLKPPADNPTFLLQDLDISRPLPLPTTSHHFPPLQSQGDGHCSDTLGDLRFEMAPTQELGHLRTAWKTGGTLRRASAPPLYVLPREGKDTVQQTTAMTRVGHWELIVMLWDPRSPPTETVYHLPPGSHFPAAKRR